MEQRNINSHAPSSAFRHIDWLTFGLYVVLVIAGAFSIYAASYDFDEASIFSMDEFSGKQILWIGISAAVGFVILMLDMRMIEAYAYPIYLGIIFLLIITIFIAPDVKGSRSWIVLGSMSIQPAEFAKFATALALAKLFSTYGFKLNDRLENYGLALAIIFMPLVLIICQKETGSALVFLSLFFVLYREGMSGLVLLAAFCSVLFFVLIIKYAESTLLGIPTGQSIVFILIMVIMVMMVALYGREGETARNLILWFAGSGIVTAIFSLCGLTLNGYVYFLGAILVGCGYLVFMAMRGRGRGLTMTISTVVVSVAFLFSVNFAFNNVLAGYQQQRIKVSLGIEEDLRGVGYNVNQSKIAIGSGGIVGKGFLNGTQTKLKYVPEQHTDFIFCTVGEEEGFIGTTLVLVLFLTLILRVISIAERQPTIFARVYAYCVASYFIFHLCINIGMVVGLCPVIGIPLPFFSYGGSSLLGFTILLFILLRLDAARRDSLSY